MIENKGDKNMDSETTRQLRNELLTFTRWTVGLSTFILTVSVSILAFTEIPLTCLTKYAISAITIFSFTNIFISWLYIRKYIFVIMKAIDLDSRGKPVPQDLDGKFNQFVNNASYWDIAIFLSFILCVANLIVFLMSVIQW